MRQIAVVIVLLCALACPLGLVRMSRPRLNMEWQWHARPRAEGRQAASAAGQDQTRTCAGCLREFTWTAEEQADFLEWGLSAPPELCVGYSRAHHDGTRR